VNFRILPGETVASVMNSIRGIVNDPRIAVSLVKQEEPSAVSPTESASYRMIATIRQVIPGVLVAPALTVVRTDSSHFLDISDAVYRFRPLRFTAEDLTRIHGVNERLAVDAYAGLVRFYVQRNSALLRRFVSAMRRHRHQPPANDPPRRCHAMYGPLRLLSGLISSVLTSH
jgi:carboxypeptidase PM20D1